MSRTICPYTEEDVLPMVCILESQGETNIDCDKCEFKRRTPKKTNTQ